MGSPLPGARRAADRKTSRKRAKIALIQAGPSGADRAKNVSSLLELVDQACRRDRPDFVVLPELSTTQYFCGDFNTKYFEWAEPIPGPTTERFSKKARELGCHVLLPLFERGPLSGEFYNSVAVIDDGGAILEGTLADGSRVNAYRKVHIPTIARPPDPGTIEKNFFKPGPGFAVFETKLGRIGCLICYDRSFPESWRSLSLLGAEIVFVPLASPTARREETFLYELRTAAVQNGIFVAACNKGGLERVEADRNFFGSSCVIDPMGEIVALGPRAKGNVIVTARVDLSKIDNVRIKYPYLRDRRPEVYSAITNPAFSSTLR